ncbi:hypothetical protein PT276_03985 [Orbaceae bacterium ESL0721]|nr:hypothetical protein [Orbaceae bacterium ESL0721]
MNIISLLVVIYNKKISDSKSLLSLLNIDEQVIDNLTIWNNGPDQLTSDQLINQLQHKVAHLELIDDLSNSPLSHVYNTFIDKHLQSDYFVILDDDSILEESYLSLLKSLKSEKMAHLILPKIVQHQQIHYPLIGFEPIVNEKRLTAKNCRSIGSGLIFNSELVANYKRQFNQTVFDERFALYGVDTSFFFRLAQIDSALSIICKGELSHSLSRLNSENREATKFRLYERAIDVALSARLYPSFVTYKPFIKYLLKSVIKNRDGSLFYLLVKSYILAAHPKCQ